jgi:primosomal protein N' (replication factor Y)
MNLCSVLLPLPLPQSFSYTFDDALLPQIAVGVRVIVPFGARRYYTAIVTEVLPPNAQNGAQDGAQNEAQPAATELKSVLQVLDSRPVVLPETLKLWQWMAQYYLCSMGEVMRAALPSGMKLESETTVCARSEYEEDEDNRLTPAEREVLRLLGTKPISIAALEKLTERKNLLPVVRRLVDTGAVTVQEEITPAYKPKTTRMVRLVMPPGSCMEAQGLSRPANARLTECFALVGRAEKQQKLLLKLLDMSGVMTTGTTQPIEQSALLNAVGCTTATLTELRRKGIVTIEETTLATAQPDDASTDTAQPHPLSEAQQAAHDAIVEAFRTQDVCLLHGVTSSGKTEVYMHLMQRCLDSGRSVLMMLPEIALTTQLTARLRRVFGKNMVVYHSKLSDRGRVEIWHSLLNDDTPRLVVGVRSSVLLPLRRVGLIIVDEEHEPSFKQQDPAPRYHGRDTAIVLAHLLGAKVLLGSATPSLESYYQALTGKYAFVQLTRRHADRPLPRIELTSMLQARREHSMSGPFTPHLVQLMRQTVGGGKQVILFQNRRGFAPMVECPQCAWSPRCPRCDVSLTYHKSTGRMTCHYCGYTQPIPGRCPSCGGEVMEQVGYGTERIEESVKALMPQVRTSRMDTDTTAGRNSYDRLLREFGEGKSQVLIGTQMVSKGLDFNDVALVGVMNADAMLKMPDFRAAERAFQLMEQVAGRAGRHGGGSVVIQCSDPNHPLLRRVVAHDYEGMVRDQLTDRKRFGYPPYTRMIALYLKGRYEDRTERLAQHYAQLLRRIFGDRVLGPEAPIVSRIKLFYIRMILIKIERNASTTDVRQNLLWADEQMHQDPDYARAVIYYDVDPM